MKWSRFLALILCALLIVPQSCAFAEMRLLDLAQFGSIKNPEDCTSEELSQYFEFFLSLDLLLDTVSDTRERMANGEEIHQQGIMDSVDPRVLDYFDQEYLVTCIYSFLNVSNYEYQLWDAFADYGWNLYGEEIYSRVSDSNLKPEPTRNPAIDGMILSKHPKDCTNAELLGEYTKYYQWWTFLNTIIEVRERIEQGEDISTSQIVEMIKPDFLQMIEEEQISIEKVIELALEKIDVEIVLMQKSLFNFAHLYLDEIMNRYD